MTHDWHWGFSNASLTNATVWLEPWCDDFDVPPRSSLTIQILNPDRTDYGLEIDVEDAIVVWARGGDLLDIFIDGERQRSGSSTIKVPWGSGLTTKEIMGIVFSGQPQARLAGKPYDPPPTLWQKIKGLLRR